MSVRSIEAEIARRLGWSQKRVRRVLAVVSHQVTHELAAQHRVTLRGLGTFVARELPPRRWFSALLKTLVLVPRRTAIRFRSSDTLKRVLDEDA